MSVTLRQLEVFVAVARSGSLAEAAARVNLSAPAASVALRNLESSSGGPLFVRAGRGLRLNDRGRRLLTGAEGLVAGVREWVGSARGGPDALTGQLRLGCSMTIGNYCMPALLARFRTLMPKVTVAMLIGNSEEVATGLRDGTIDLGLVESEEIPADLDAEHWTDDVMVVVGPAGHPLGQRGLLSPKDLAGQHWLVREPGSGTLSVTRGLLAKVPGIAGTTEWASVEALMRGVEHGMGLALLSMHAVADKVEAGRLVVLPLRRAIHRRFYLLTYPGQHASTLASAFKAWLRHNKPERHPVPSTPTPAPKASLRRSPDAPRS